MGEKIRDIYPIRIGSIRFMVELNEGYVELQGGGGGYPRTE